LPENPAVKVEMHPLFVQGAQTPLWGRQDFMKRYDVTFLEGQQRFIITTS